MQPVLDLASVHRLKYPDAIVARVRRWRTLAAEEAHNSESLAKRRARDRAFGRLVRNVVKGKRSRQQE